MKRGARRWMAGRREVVKNLPHPDETWMVKDIRTDEGEPHSGKGLKSYGIIETVERPGYGKSNVYRTDPEAYEYIQERFGGDSGGSQ